MTHVGYVVAGYTITFGAVAVYAAWVMVKTRALTRSSAPGLVDQVSHAPPDRPNLTG